MSSIPKHVLDYYRRFNADEDLANKAYAERNSAGKKSDILYTHNLTEEKLKELISILTPFIEDIAKVYIVKRKLLYVPEDPLWVVIVKTNIPWFHITIKNQRQKLGHYLGEKLKGFFTIGTYVVCIDHPIYLKKVKLNPSSLVLQR